MNDNKIPYINKYKIKQEYLDIINDKINFIVETKLIKLQSDEKKLIIDSLKKLILMISLYFFENKNQFINQIFMNDNRDIYSMLVLLMPFFNLDNIDKINSFDDMLKNKNNYESTYYIDHQGINIKEYLNDNLKAIFNTIMTCKYKLCVNWLNVYPYHMEDYKNSEIYKNFAYLYKSNKFVIDEYNCVKTYSYDINDLTENLNDEFNNIDNIFLLGNDTLLGTITNFLYNDIKTIKWMIYDVLYENELYPTIIILNDLFDNKISDVCNNSIKKINKIKLDDMENKWNIIINDYENNKKIINSVVLFYLRWEKDETNLKNIKLNNSCKELLKNFNEKINNEEIDEKDETIMILNDNTNECLKNIIPQLKFENLYNYIFICMQQFKYTWYGYFCLTDDKKIKTKSEYLKNIINNDLNLDVDKTYKINENTNYHITPKNIYNYFKSLIHYGTDFKQFNSYKYNSLSEMEKEIFINRLNKDINIENWFNIKNNIKNLKIIKDANITDYMNLIRNKILNTELIPTIIFETLIYNGILTFCKYKPELTDNLILPDKNTKSDERKKVIKNKITIYDNSYHFLNNTKFNKINNYNNNFKEGLWSTNFGGDWMAQLQIFHHFINQRILLITGGTGAGKSTIAPFMMVYASKIINYNNNAKVVCTQPRSKPVKDNASRIASQLGIPINADFDINYIQYSFGNDLVNKIVDDYYHPCLRLLTDGKLYNTIQNNCILKYKNNKYNNKYNNKTNNKEMFIKKNLFDVILVDEAHEHNVFMDMILTLCKFGIYINNQITLGIISATMDTDEVIYRNFFNCIDDNWKYPIELNKNNYNNNLIDRRIHLSVPFGSINYPIEEPTFKKDKTVYEILMNILNTSTDGDILIFESGSKNIKDLVTKINTTTPPNIYALPFYSELKETTRKKAEEIAKKEVRDNIDMPKNIPVYEYDELTPEEQNKLKVKKGTYTRFIIVATNIAEASITINSLKYVIDTVKQKINIYDIDSGLSQLQLIDIAKPNSVQRRGRVGRVKPGVLYRTYDFNTLSDTVLYKICIEDISEKIFPLISSETEYLFKNNDPYNSNNDLPEYLKSQYYDNNNKNTIIKYNKKNINNIVYPKIDCKYDLNVLKDNENKFYLIHPNIDDIRKVISYKNKITSIINYFELLGLVNKNGKNTNLGKLVDKYKNIIDDETITIKHILMCIDCIRLTNDEEILNLVILYIVFSSNNLQIKTKTYGVSDFIEKSKILNKSIFNRINLNDIIDNNFKLPEFKNTFSEKVKNLINSLPKNENFNFYDTILSSFYNIKLQLLLITNNNILNKFIDTLEKKDENMYLEIIELNNEIIKPIYLQTLLSNYELTAYIIGKNYSRNILLKLQGTPFYVNYYNRDINYLYQLNEFTTSYGKTITNTYVENIYRNNLILYNDASEERKISNIMLIPSSTIKLINLPIIRNINLDKNKIEIVYGKEIYNLIVKNINLIVNEINK
jgi:hypothetical protein